MGGKERRTMTRGDRHGSQSQGIESALTEEQRAQVAALLGATDALARALHAAGPDRAALSSALQPVRDTDEPVAAAYAAGLGAARGAGAQAAADVATVIGELDTRHEVAREARRSRVRLRSAGAAHAIVIPPAQPVAPSLAATPIAPISLAPRAPLFIEAHVTRSREAGELTLVIIWQEGADADTQRGYLFLLDFWREGIKDFEIADPMSRARVQSQLIAPLTQRDGPGVVKIGWAQARGLVLQALAVNDWRKAAPAAEFTRFRAQLDERLLAEPANATRQEEVIAEQARMEREGDRPLFDINLEAEETLANWLGAWSLGDYGLSYDLLSADHSARRGVSRAEYVALRRQWAAEADPAALRLTVIREQEQRASALWTPSSAPGRLGTGGREIEAFWSMTLTESPIGGQLPELPMGTLISKSTGRHWFWTGHTLRRDPSSNLWLVAASRDEGAQSQGLPVEELTKRVKEQREKAERTATEAQSQPEGPATSEALRAVTAYLTTALHYSDALMTRLPLDETICREAINDARALGTHERAAALLERMVGRFQDDVDVRFELGVEQYLVSEQYSQQGQHEPADSWLGRATATMTDVASAAPTARHLQGLGELLSRQGHFTQAAERLRQAVAIEPENATLYLDLSETLMGQAGAENLDAPEKLDDAGRQAAMRGALDALRAAAKIDASLPRLFTRIGAVQEALHQHEDAIISLEEAIQRDRDDDLAQYTLGALHMARKEPEKALRYLELASQMEPASLQYRVAVAACYVALERVREATRELDTLDKIAPGLPQTGELRARLARIAKKK
jgi:tetratricopeptide (TPR) repeat protein